MDECLKQLAKGNLSTAELVCCMNIKPLAGRLMDKHLKTTAKSNDMVYNQLK